MLIHGARAALPNSTGRMVKSLLARAHVNSVMVALAAKLARIICAVLRSGQLFEIKATLASASTGSIACAHRAPAAEQGPREV